MNEHATHTDLLIQYLDGELQGEQLETIQKDIDENPASREELESLRMAKEATKSYALKSRISSIHHEMMHEMKKTSEPKTPVIRMIAQYSFRVAAVLILLFGISSLYQYITATPEKLFSENFNAFALHETRGSSTTILEDLYEKGDMKTLLQQFELLKTPRGNDYFLAGNAYLSTRQPAKAIETFLNLQQFNRTNNTHFFDEDLEYYLALSYLGNNEPAKALPLFEKIHADPNHPYHEAVSSWFLSKVKKTFKNDR